MGEELTAEQREAMQSDDLASRIGSAQQLCVDVPGRTIFFMSEVTDEEVLKFAAALMVLDKTDGDIRLVLNSHGGQTTSGFAIYDMIRAARNFVDVDAYGACQSMGAMVLQAGRTRRLAENCEFMIHASQMTLGEDSHTEDELEICRQRMVIDNERLYRILARRSGRSVDKIRKLCQRDHHLTAAAAVREGFADSIIKGLP